MSRSQDPEGEEPDDRDDDGRFERDGDAERKAKIEDGPEKEERRAREFEEDEKAGRYKDQ